MYVCVTVGSAVLCGRMMLKLRCMPMLRKPEYLIDMSLCE